MNAGPLLVVGLVVGVVAGAAGPAAAQPGVFGGCPRGPVRDARDDGAVIEDFVVTMDDDGTRRAVPVLRRCKPLPVRGGKARGAVRCIDAGDHTPALSLTREPGLRGKVARRPGDHHWMLVDIYAGRRRIARWRSDTPVDCVGRIFVSPDRRTVIAEITLSKKFMMSEHDAKRVLPLRLARPLP